MARTFGLETRLGTAPILLRHRAVWRAIRSFSDDFEALALDDAWVEPQGTWTLDTANGEIDSSGMSDDVLARMVYRSDGVVKFRYRMNSGSVSEEALTVLLRTEGEPEADGLVVAFATDQAGFLGY